MPFKRFEELPVWQKSKDLAVQVYRITQSGKIVKCYSLVEQIRRSAVSISSNIAEGFERGSRKEFIQFLYFAKGSAGELRSQLLIAFELGYLDENISKELRILAIRVSEQLAALIMALKKRVMK